MKVAYFSAEFGLHESLPIYSGGLGILAGDHLKSASELAIPLTAVGLLYRNGYFQQYLSADGWQQEAYPELDFYNLPVELMRYTDGSPIHIRVDMPENAVFCQVWRANVGGFRSICSTRTRRKTHPRIPASPGRFTAAGTEMPINRETGLG